MSDAPTYLSCILNEGKFAIGQALVQRKKLQPYKFVVGDTYSFTPTEDATTVKGNIVYIGERSLITGYITSKDTFKYNLTFPESSGPFTIGNIMVYVKADDGTVFPFMWAAMKIPYPKQAQENNTVGNRFVFEFIEKIINANDALNITVQPSDYFSLPGYVTEYDLPSPSEALFQQFYVQEPKFSPVPFIGARRSIDNSYWGMPLYSRIGDPFFGILNGGIAGEKKSTVRIYWGGRLNIPNDDLQIIYGGSTLSDRPSTVIGGLPLEDNPGYDTGL